MPALNQEEFGSPLRWILASRLRLGVAVLLGWSVVGFLSAAHWQLFFLGDSPYTWWQLLRIKLLLWYVWGAFTLGIVRAGRRYRPEGPRWRSRWLALFALSIVFVTAYLAVYSLAIWWHLRWMGNDNALTNLVSFVLAEHSTFYYLAFWATLGVDYALEYAWRLKEKERISSQLQAQLTEAKLHALQARLQPHFLFNALNTIASMVHERRADEAYDVLTRLSELLRQSLRQSQAPQVTLARELEFVRHYLEIVRARFPDRLSFKLEHDRTADAVWVPTLILQPLVENAVVHGLKDHTARLNLVVTCRRENGALEVSVEDNGPGLPADFDPLASDGFGLASTQARLASLYDGRARFTVSARIPHGTVARLTLPVPEEPTPSAA